MYTLGVNWNGQDYVLVNLNLEQINELKNDAEKLESYLQDCLETGCNIYSTSGCNEMFNSDLTSQQQQQPTSKQSVLAKESSTPCVSLKQLALAPIKSNVITQTATSGASVASCLDVPSRYKHLTCKQTILPKKSSAAFASFKQVDKSSINSNVITHTAISGVGIASNKRSAPFPTEMASSLDDDGSSSVSKAKKNKKTKTLTHEEKSQLDELIATLVMEQPLLYNYKLNSNKFAGMKAEKWKLICDKLNKEIPNAEMSLTKTKDRWATIRDNFLKTKRLSKSGDGFEEFDEDPMHEILSGLNDVYGFNETSSNITEPGVSSEDFKSKSSTSKQGKMKDKSLEEGALKVIEASSEKFLSAIEGMKDSLLKKKETSSVNDKVTKFCDLLALQLRDLDDRVFIQAQIEILQVISKLNEK